ncbi:MAG: signal peptide peptidase SppA [Leptolyngbya sp. SIO4C1]|nr:signal peptide peptidase SppA [Leptolyngbya sp. SIO4C1]
MRDFLKYAAASALGTLVGLFTLIALLSLGAIGLVGVLIASSSEEAAPELEEKSMLVFDLSTDIADAVPYGGAGVVFEETFYGESYRAVSLYSALAAIRAAAEDEKIAGIYLTGNTNEGFATLQELRTALSDFKDSGKPIVAYSTGWNERDYYLTSVANKIYLNPVGLLELNGFRAEIQFLAGALKKYGVGVQVLRAGRYKSAVEPFIRETSSPEERQQTQAILGDLWQDFLTTVSSDRSLTQAQLQQLADDSGLLVAEEAQSAGLIDSVGFFDEVLSELQTITDSEEVDDSDLTDLEAEDLFPQTNLLAYSQIVEDRRDSFGDDTIAIVYAEGEIVPGDGIDPGLITSDGLARTLRQVRLDDEVKAVVLRVNSPGGSALASEIIAREVQLLADEKPVMVSMGDYAASGGYMIAAPGAKIFASPSTITGSIGVYGLLLNIKEIANRNGVTWDVIKTAKLADIDTISRPQTQAELQLQQDFVNRLYSRFVALVAESRDVTQERVNQVAQGRVWTGIDATQADLVDEMGGLEAAIAAAGTAAELEDWQVQEYPKPISLEEQIIESLFGDGAVMRLPWAKDPLSEEVLKLRDNLQLLKTLDDPNSMYMRLPFTTEIN